MSSPAREIRSNVRHTGADEISGYMQIAKLEPQELMRFLEFCLGKIHEEVGSPIERADF